MRAVLSKIIILFSALVVFNFCFFICVNYDGNKPAWICFLFFHLAFLLSFLGYFFTTRRRFKILNIQLATISMIYLIVTVITCTIFLFNPDCSKELELFVFLIELLLYLLSFHYCYLTNRKAEDGIIEDLRNSSEHDSWITELRLLANASGDRERRNVLNSVIDEIRSSPSLSNSSVYDVDNEIQSLIRGLKSDYANMQIAELSNYKDQICLAVRKRTEILKCCYHKIK